MTPYTYQRTNTSTLINKEILRNSNIKNTDSLETALQRPPQAKPPVDFKQFMMEKREAAKKKWQGIKSGFDSLNSNTKQFMKGLDLTKPNPSMGRGARPKTQFPRRECAYQQK